jgi:hypothetical protein
MVSGVDCGPDVLASICSAAASRRATAELAAGTDAALPPVAPADGEPLGDGDPLLDVVDEGLGDGDELGDCDGLGDVLGEGVVLVLGDAVGDREPVRQLAAAIDDWLPVGVLDAEPTLEYEALWECPGGLVPPEPLGR